MCFDEIVSIDLRTRRVALTEDREARVTRLYARGGAEVDRPELAESALIADSVGSWCLIMHLRRFSRCEVIWP